LLFKAFETTMKPQKIRRQLTDEERQGLWEAQGSVCISCGCTGSELEVDHISPLFVGGADSLENLQVLCKLAMVKNQAGGAELR
jgi:Restriction endonuclease